MFRWFIEIIDYARERVLSSAKEWNASSMLIPHPLAISFQLIKRWKCCELVTVMLNFAKHPHNMHRHASETRANKKASTMWTRIQVGDQQCCDYKGDIGTKNKTTKALHNFQFGSSYSTYATNCSAYQVTLFTPLCQWWSSWPYSKKSGHMQNSHCPYLLLQWTSQQSPPLTDMLVKTSPFTMSNMNVFACLVHASSAGFRRQRLCAYGTSKTEISSTSSCVEDEL